jgi:hypothetical protein
MQGASPAAADTLPAGTIAHRLGDFVFTYHGIDFAGDDPRLWVVMVCYDEQANQGAWPSGKVFVGRLDGLVDEFPPDELANQLAKQNAIRVAAGLPDLRDPRLVRHGRPIVRENR